MRGASFPQIARRGSYTVKPDGSFLSYPVFRKKHYAEIAEDCCFRCVYCGSHEDDVGGRDCMELDHFRPYRDPRFHGLRDNPSNFHHSCARCNRLKGSCWHGDAERCHDGVCGFIDPFVEDRANYFEIDERGVIRALQGPGDFIIELLHLNRPFLLRLRNLSSLVLAAKSVAQRVVADEGRTPEDAVLLARLVLLMQQISE